MNDSPSPTSYFVVFCMLAYKDIDEARATAPEAIAAHLARSNELHRAGSLLMAGAFLDHPDQPLRTMAVLTSREAADDYIRGDPFVQMGKVSHWEIREWANMLR